MLPNDKMLPNATNDLSIFKPSTEQCCSVHIVDFREWQKHTDSNEVKVDVPNSQQLRVLLQLNVCSD